MNAQLLPKYEWFAGHSLLLRHLLGLTRTLGLGGLLVSVAVGCSGGTGGDGSTSAQGGVLAQTGGAMATGGTGSPTSGGSANTNTGGANAGKGGAMANGGSAPANGGSTPGGASANGGSATGNGGSTAVGGATTGGAKATGGAATSGGATARGGASTGGASANGGTSSSGAATGGATSKGGTSSSGATGNGGAPGKGGATGNGGATGIGGATTSANDLWIATNGSDTNPGTEASPFLTLSGAQAKVSAGQTIWIKSGTYSWSTTQKLTKSGSASSPIRVFAAAGARPVIDFSGQPRDDSSARGIQISGAYWHLKGFDVMKAGDNCIHISGSNNTIEWLSIHGCCDSGLQITDSAASNNTVLNCDSYENYDGANGGENADGFAAKLELGPGNLFRGCRAWNNSDDGWDLYAASGLVTIEDSWAFLNGKPTTANGDGNGFKLGGAGGGAPHQVTNCFSIDNLACGFARNNNTMVPVLSQCGGKGDGKGTLCSLTNPSPVSFTMTSAEAKAVVRNADGSLPAIK